MTSSAISARPYLALNCAEERIQVVLGTAEGLLFSEEVLCPGQSIRHLPTAMERALRVHGTATGDLAGHILNCWPRRPHPSPKGKSGC
jgi:hypothetical protein